MVKRYAHLSKARITGVLAHMTESKLTASPAQAASPAPPHTPAAG